MHSTDPAAKTPCGFCPAGETAEVLDSVPADLRILFERRFGAPAPGGTPVHASAPGRIELAGNHTDHQGGPVIAAAIGERLHLLACRNGTSTVRVAMEGFGEAAVDVGTRGWHEPLACERGTSQALVRGMLARFAAGGGAPAGFDATVVSRIPAGAGLSSSAAFEVCVGAAVEALFGDWAACPRDPVALAVGAVEVERAYFGKPCGAQDQMACALGGVVALDFAGTLPSVEVLNCDFSTFDHVAVLIDSACDHTPHTDAFAAIPAQMRSVAAALGRSRLADVDPGELLAYLPRLRAELGDRAVLRALHYAAEARRVPLQRAALEAGDLEAFLAQMRFSGASSAQYLQNVSVASDDPRASQSAMVVLALCAHLLEGRGAWRIHGGGFGGCALALVPRKEAVSFTAAMDAALGYAACRVVEPGASGVRATRLL